MLIIFSLFDANNLVNECFVYPSALFEIILSSLNNVINVNNNYIKVIQ